MMSRAQVVIFTDRTRPGFPPCVWLITLVPECFKIDEIVFPTGALACKEDITGGYPEAVVALPRQNLEVRLSG